MSTDYEAGYRAGYEAGDVDGYAQGKQHGYEDGYDDGFDDGRMVHNNSNASNEVLLHLLDSILDEIVLEYDGVVITHDNIRDIVMKGT